MRILITGITGTLGQELLKIAEGDENVREILGVSRDEQKQRSIHSPKLTKRLCDIRDFDGLFGLSQNIDLVFHCAALKCVDTLEENPFEAIKTNIEGTRNVITAARDSGVPIVVLATTDKAVFPINIYGITKAAAERLVLNAGYSACRYGNVLGSRGSVIPIFVRAIQEGRPMPITSPEMTRFWIPIQDAAKFIYGVGMSNTKGLQIPNMKAAKIMDVALVVADIMDKKDYPHEFVGIRAGEKIHECLFEGDLSRPQVHSNTCEQYTHAELVELISPVVRGLLG